MRIIDGKRFYKKEMDAAVRIDNDGWDRYNGRNYQWYSLYYNQKCGYVRLEASNSGDCYGDYGTYHFSNPQKFANAHPDWADLLGDIDEYNQAAMHFADTILSKTE